MMHNESVENIIREVKKNAWRKRTVLIIEGIEDIQFYHNILSLNGKNDEDYIIRESELVLGTGGCNSIIDIFQYLSNRLKEQGYLDAVLGIIDKDIANDTELSNRTLPDNVFKLQYYSFESHCISIERIADIVEFQTFASKDYINDKVVSKLEKNVSNAIMEKLYYMVLEALRDKLDEDYNGKLTFDSLKRFDLQNKKKLNRKYIELNIEELESELDEYYKYLNMHYSWSKDDIVKKFMKGKTLLTLYADELGYSISNLSSECMSEKGICIRKSNYGIDKCASCIWQLKIGNAGNASIDTYKQLKVVRNIYSEIKYISDFLCAFIERMN